MYIYIYVYKPTPKHIHIHMCARTNIHTHDSMSKSLDQSATHPMAQSGATGEASAAARPPSATAQALLDRERAHNSRPHR